jgi:hypothetical protein
VGKTALVEQYEHHDNGAMLLKFEGLQPATRPRRVYRKERARQLQEMARVFAFYFSDSDVVAKLISFGSYIDFFSALADAVEEVSKSQMNHSYPTARPAVPRIAILLDEIQWLAAYNDELFSELKPIWDNRLSHLANLRLYISGSSPSFVVSQFASRAALFGREDVLSPLRPFNIEQTARYLRCYRDYGRRDILNAQLVTGGVVGYLEAIARGHDSAFRGVMHECFRADGQLFRAYESTFVSSLATNRHYEHAVRYLAHNRYASRDQIAYHLTHPAAKAGKRRQKVTPRTPRAGGRVTTLLNDLIACGFVERYSPLSHHAESSRLVRYRLVDAYLNFYLRLVEPHRQAIAAGKYHGAETRAISRNQYAVTLGFAFERFMISNCDTLAEILQFADTSYAAGSFFNRKAGEGFQIDLLYVRRDETLVFCELKHWHTPVSARSTSRELETKISRFHEVTAGRYANFNVRRVLVATEGVQDPPWASEYFDRVVTLETLFEHWRIHQR